MTKETEVALAAIDALCSKRKAKALRKLVLKAVESERGTTWIGTSGASTTWIDALDATTINVPNAPITYTT